MKISFPALGGIQMMMDQNCDPHCNIWYALTRNFITKPLFHKFCNTKDSKITTPVRETVKILRLLLQVLWSFKNRWNTKEVLKSMKILHALFSSKSHVVLAETHKAGLHCSTSHHPAALPLLSALHKQWLPGRQEGAPCAPSPHHKTLKWVPT